MDEHCSLNVARVFKVYYGFVIFLKIFIVLGYLGCTFHLLDLCFWSFRPEGLLVRCLTDLKVVLHVVGWHTKRSEMYDCLLFVSAIGVMSVCGV